MDMCYILVMSMERIAVISDTHGLLREEIIGFLESCDGIIHAGDVGSEEILNRLSSIAPLTVVRGNCDTGPWAKRLGLTETLQIGNRQITVIHNVDMLDVEAAGSFDMVIFGHTHRPHREERNGVLYLNPGSIGPRRFDLPISYALITLEEGQAEIAFHEIKV